MTTNDKTQLRGNCQCCGRDQAVKSGRMSKHGYTVDHGWFNGVCSGQHFAPMQKDTTQTAAIVRTVREDCARLVDEAKRLREGKSKPQTVTRGLSRNQRVEIPFADAETWEQEDAVRSAIYARESRARAGEQFAAQLERLAAEVHGQPLREVKVAGPAAPIWVGEKRQGEKSALTCTRVDGARVYWTNERGFKGWTGSAAWRRFELIAG